MTTFTTTIDAMYTLDTPDPGFVVNVLWTVTGVDGQHTASIGGNSQFTVQEGTFTPYTQLTQEQVIGWIPANQIDSAQACVQGQINSMITPPVSPQNTPLPWGSQA
jgi:hypothetical protein